MKREGIDINTDILEWAIQRAGFQRDTFALQFPDIQKWLDGDKKPTLSELEKFANKVHVPFGYLFLDTPPAEDQPVPFFRSGKKRPTHQVSLNIFDTIQQLLRRQEWLSEYLEEEGFERLPFVGKYKVEDTFSAILNDIRKELHIGDNWASLLDNKQQALDILTEKIEEAGIIVVFNSVVGNDTHRSIDVNECRGFVLIDPYVPFLFVNAADAKAGQLFTLMHEVAHIWLGESAGFNNQKLLPANDPIELLCDKIAAELLVPQSLFQDIWQREPDIEKLSKLFKVSPIVIARRALDMGYWERGHFFAFYNAYMEDFKQKKENASSGGDFYATQKKRLSIRFAAFVDRAVRQNQLLYTDAYRLTGIKGDTYEKFTQKQLAY